MGIADRGAPSRREWASGYSNARRGPHEVFGAVQATSDRLDILINNAGIGTARSLSKLRGREPGYGPRREFDCRVVGTQWSVCRRQQPLLKAYHHCLQHTSPLLIP